MARYISEHYYAVKFNAEGNEEIAFYDQVFRNPNYDPNRRSRNSTHQFTQFLGIRGYPTMVFFSEDGDPIMPVVGYYTPQQLEPYLKMIKQGDYAVFTKPEDIEIYLKNFVPRFRKETKRPTQNEKSSIRINFFNKLSFLPNYDFKTAGGYSIKFDFVCFKERA